MKVRCKFRCLAIAQAYTGQNDTTAATITMAPVWEQDGVNREWSKATPSGKLEMLITNPAAAEAFELGKTYYLDLTPAD